MTNQELWDLIDGCRQRGVLHIKLDIGVEFTLTPSLGAAGGDIFDALSKPLDPNKCAMCQNAPCDGRLAGHCRACSLKAAGAS